MIASVFSGLADPRGDRHWQQWPCCPIQGLPWASRQRQRRQAIAALGLGGQTTPPAWEEAAQLAAQFLGAPMAVVTIADHHTEYFQAAYGLSCRGVGNPLSQQRQLPLDQGLGVYVLDSEQPLVLADTVENPVVAESTLVTTYDIRAYCGVPLVTCQGICLGTLAVMDIKPRPFTDQDVAFLAMAARWGMSEYERQSGSACGVLALSGQGFSAPEAPGNTLRLRLTNRLTQELRNPLSTVMGMATMLNREIYGPLTPKQREYNDIVHRSSQVLLGLVDEILELGQSSPLRDPLPTPIDIELLGKQVLATLTPLADEQGQTLNLTVEPNENHWILDQHLVKQILYHLIFSLMQVAGENSTLRLHACRRGPALALGAWLSNPWTGEGLPSEIIEGLQQLTVASTKPEPALAQPILGLLLSQQLAQRHGGQLKVQGDIDSGCRLVILLPVLDTTGGVADLGHSH